MANYANFNREDTNVLTGKDGVIIRKHIFGLEGGRVLNPDAIDGVQSAYPIGIIPCGTPVAKGTVSNETVYIAVYPKDTTAEGSTSYAYTLPSGFAYVGIAAATVKAGAPCPVMVSGVVNEVALLDDQKQNFPSSMETPTDLSLSALKTACPHLIFTDEEKLS